ncbi:MAG: AAA family ATPase [Nonomuraea sp.]|nr:AAA family ATPase [Nonomuraea sp.]
MYDDLDDLPDHHFPAMALGTGYALYRHGQDAQAEQIINALSRQDSLPSEIHVHVSGEDERGVAPVNVLDFASVEMPSGLEDYIGQEPLKRQLMVYLNAAKAWDKRLPHMLLASGYPGVGKTTLARVMAVLTGVKIIELVPPFNVYTLVEAAQKLDDHDILFIDEIHKLADSGKRGSELLLKVLEEGVAFLPDGTAERLPDITIIGATTDRDKLPEPVVDRFKWKPYFQAYTEEELARIAIKFAYRHHVEGSVDDWLAANIAFACRGTPRIVEEMVEAAGALAITLGRNATPAELLEFLEVEPDGLTRTHIHYLTAMRQYFAREAKDGGVEYIVGEAAIKQILRETDQGIGRIERFLVERGLVDRTPRGRRLTDMGIDRAERFIAMGKGVANVA